MSFKINRFIEYGEVERGGVFKIGSNFLYDGRGPWLFQDRCGAKVFR